MKCDELKAICATLHPKMKNACDGAVEVYTKSEVDEAISELKADYKEACDRLQTANLIAKEQKDNADKLLSCLKCLVMRDLIKDCPEKDSVIEIVKEFK